MRVLSLGLGVQSMTMAYMSLRGDLPPVDAMLFADTLIEPAAVYRQLAAMQEECRAASVPLFVVSAGDLGADILSGGRFAPIPAYIRNEQGKPAILRRQCTNEYKLAPIRKKERQLLGLQPRQRAKGVMLERWIGISVDEAGRMKDSQDSYARNVYPLVDAGMSRHDCKQWLRRNNIPEPEKSACIICPFHTDGYWRDMKENRPGDWARAVEVDAHVRTGLHKVTCEGYLHRSLVPLPMVDFTTQEEQGQGRLWADGFGNECEGLCGT